MSDAAPSEPKKSWWQEFKEFATTGDLMTIAVAFIMGLAVKGLIDSFVKDIFMGTVGLIVDCKDIVEMLSAEEQVKEAARAFKAVLTAAASFGGEEIVEI